MQPGNVFLNFLCELSAEADFEFILRGVSTLLNTPLIPGWLPNSGKQVNVFPGSVLPGYEGISIGVRGY